MVHEEQLRDILIQVLGRVDDMLSYCRETDYSNTAMYSTGEVHDGFCEGFGHTSLLEVIKPLMDLWSPDLEVELSKYIKLRETDRYRGFIKQALTAQETPNVQDSYLPHLTQEEWQEHRALLFSNIPGYEKDLAELESMTFESVLKRDFDNWSSQKDT